MLNGLQKLIKPTGVTKFAGSPGGLLNFPFGSNFTWMGWNKTLQLQGGYGNKIVYAYANVLVTKLIEVPITVSEIVKEREARKLASFNFGNNANKSGKYNIQEIKALRPMEKHPFINLMDSPNDYQTWIDLMEAFWFNYVISGDGYIWPERIVDGSRAGEPVRLHVLPSNLVMPVRNQADINSTITYYQFTSWTGQIVRIEPEDLMHLSQWSPFDPVLGGYSPLVPGAKSIATNEANQEAQGRAYQNGSTGIIISSDVGGSDKEVAFHKMTEEQMRDIKETVNISWIGTINNKGTHVTNGAVVVNKLGDTLAELQLIEAEKSNWKDGGALFGVNPILVGDMSGGTENNVQVAYKALVLNNVIPKIRKFDAMLRKFANMWYPTDSIWIQHDVKSYPEITADQKLMKEIYGDADWIDQNEKRRLIGDLDDMEAYNGVTLVAGGKKTLQQIIDGNFEDPLENAKQLDYRG